MFEWISQNSKVLTFFTNLGTLAIWLGYAQLLYMGFRRQRRPRIIINRGKKKDIDALCIISNMSAEAIFIEYILADLETSQGTITVDVTDFDQEYSEGDEENQSESFSLGKIGDNTRQGPLESGGFLHIGTFSQVIQRLAKSEGIEMEGSRPKGDLELNRLTIRILSVYGPEDMPVGAKRSFSLQENDGNACSLTPENWDTERQSSLLQRYRLRKIMKQLNAQNFSSSSHFRHVENGQDKEGGKQKSQEEARKAAAEASRD